jgi:salicylate hydroxylase
VIPGAILKSDPELCHFTEQSTIWWGPDRTIVGIPVQNGELYSLEATHPGNTGTAGDWNKKGDHELMKNTYLDFELPVQKLIAKVKSDDLLVWKLNQLPDLDSWVFKSGKVGLLGDCTREIFHCSPFPSLILLT